MTGAKQIDNRERLARLRLARTKSVGPVAYRQLLARFGSAVAALDALPGLSAKGGAREPAQPYPQSKAEREMAAVQALGGHLMVLGEAQYPRLLAQAEDAPPVLSILGQQHLLERRTVAMVGARNASTNGRKFAEKLAHDLAGAGFLVVSGLARGIDTAAHKGALEGGTAAVLAGGPDIIYPPENQPLYEKIKAQGLIVSEMPPGVQPTARHFPRRNRIISGLSLGVVVVEAAMRSGSLITARFAGEQGREVMAAPGSPLDPRAQGANALIRDGATLVQSAADVAEVLAPRLEADLSEPDLPFFGGNTGFFQAVEPNEAARAHVAAALGPAPVQIDDLIRDVALPPAVVLAVLLELELAGRVERSAGGRVALLF